jgi:hypothetical protein
LLLDARASLLFLYTGYGGTPAYRLSALHKRLLYYPSSNAPLLDGRIDDAEPPRGGQFVFACWQLLLDVITPDVGFWE